MHPTRQPDPTAIEALRKLSGNTIAWEEMPSFADSLPQRLLQTDSHSLLSADDQHDIDKPDWSDTQPADPLPTTEMQPFEENLQGLATREVFGVEVFKRFFGRGAGG